MACRQAPSANARLLRHPASVVPATVVGVASVLAAASARGAPPAVPSIEWEGVASCTPQAEVEQHLRRLLAAREDAGGNREFGVTAQVSELDDRSYRLDLVIIEGDRTRTRVLRATSCDELAESAALVIALAVDPSREDLGAAEAAPEPAATSRPVPARAQPEPQPRPGAAPAAPTRATSAARERTRWRGLLAFGPALDTGVLPGVGLGATLALGVERASLRAELASKLLGSRSIRPQALPGAGGDLLLGALEARLCLLPRIAGDVRVGPCPVVELGVLRGGGYGIQEPEVVSKPWGSAGIGLATRVGLGPGLGAFAEADVALPFGQPNFLLDGAPVHRPAQVVGALRLLVDAQFP